jgi:protein-tyrosine phosphatase
MKQPTFAAPVRVLFVCMGNICRSPMAEAVFAHMVREAKLEEKIEIDSAGTGDWHAGRPAHHGTLQVLAAQRIPYDGRARQIVARDLDEFDYIVTMDEQNLSGVRELQSARHRAQVKPLLEFALEGSPARLVREVPDPYYDGGFDHVFDLVSEGCAGLLETIRQEHTL